MHTGKQYTFIQLINETDILIPRIQRDYIQFRNNDRVVTSRKNFVKNLVSAIEGNHQINLHFVYGYNIKHCNASNEQEAFVPIDGQQRLTTLFLLHYFVFAKSNNTECLNKLNNKLVYETRTTTNKFIECLLKNKLTDSEKIKRESWFSVAWNFDPSVLSCLVMLDEFNKAFKETSDWNEYAKRLNSEQARIISFMKLDIEDIGAPNELYIKMNSRGKQLTAFENFKTEVYKEIKGLEFCDNFKSNMDGDWLSIIWDMIPQKENWQENFTDVLFKEIIHWIIINRICAENELKKCEEIFDNIKKNNKTSQNFYLSDYFNEKNNTNLNEPTVFELAIKDIYYTFNLLKSLHDNSSDVYEDICQRIFYNSEKGFNFSKGFSSPISDHNIRSLLFSITKFAIDANDNIANKLNEFFDWWRIIKNLAFNAKIDTIKLYFDAIKAINAFKRSVDIATYLLELDETSDEPNKFLDIHVRKPNQFKEEILKQKLINKNVDWKNTIYKAESNKYFSGELLFLFKKIGLVSYEEGTDKLSEFNKYWKKIDRIFGSEIADFELKMHKLLLTYGDYSENGNGIISYYFKDYKNHDKDWRGMLRDNKSGFDIFFQMLDEYDCNMDFDNFVETRCKQFDKTKFNIDTWKRDLHEEFINNDRLFAYIAEYGRCWIDENERIALLRTSNRSSSVDYRVYSLYTNFEKDAVLYERNNKISEEYVEIKGNIFKYNEGKYTNEKNEPYKDNNNKEISTICEIVKYIRKKY